MPLRGPAYFSPSHRYTLLGVGAILLWSSSVALGRRTAEAVGPLTAGAAVYLAGGLLLLALSRGRGRARKVAWRLPPWRPLLACGGLFVTYSVALYLALGLASDRIQAIEVGLINYLWPALTLLFSLRLLHHRARLGLAPGTALALGGVFLVLLHGGGASWRDLLAGGARGAPWAFGLAFLAAVSWALYSNLTRLWAGDAGEPAAAPWFILASGAVMLIMRCFVSEPAHLDARVAVELVVFSAATAFGYAFWEQAMRRGNVVLITTLSYFTPLLSTLISSAYLGVMPGAGIWVGCVLLLAGSWLSRRSIVEEPCEVRAGAADD